MNYFNLFREIDKECDVLFEKIQQDASKEFGDQGASSLNWQIGFLQSMIRNLKKDLALEKRLNE